MRQPIAFRPEPGSVIFFENFYHAVNRQAAAGKDECYCIAFLDFFLTTGKDGYPVAVRKCRFHASAPCGELHRDAFFEHAPSEVREILAAEFKLAGFQDTSPLP